ncbi:MAG: PTS system mannose/fructose/sorbose family transporter subunit IID [bacterium]|jgi:PTS system mannose-specific IID component|nr:PTS system mannose/fructose/sorbose family transporter subunit IID [bacterium]
MAPITKLDIVKIFLRSFYIQSTWNSERLLGLGFCFCLIPVARKLFKSESELIDFLNRHLEFFNSHPYLSTYALGAVTNIEQQAIQKNWQDKRPITVFKTRIVGPLGAIGDTLFWQIIRPAFGVLAIAMLFLFGIWGSLSYLLLYNIPHFYVRIKGLIDSYIKGFDVVRELSLRGAKKYFDGFKYFASSILGVAAVVVIKKILDTPFLWTGALIFLLSGVISFYSMRRAKLTIDMLIVFVIFSSIIIGLMV